MEGFYWFRGLVVVLTYWISHLETTVHGQGKILLISQFTLI